MEQMTRSELRKKIMTILYQINVYRSNNISYQVDDVIKDVIEIDNDFVKDSVYGVITNMDKLDEKANQFLIKWTIDRFNSCPAFSL